MFTWHQIGRAITNRHKPKTIDTNYHRGDQTTYKFDPARPPEIEIDPILRQARAEEAFYAYQLQSGFEVYTNGAVHTAADAINKLLFEEAAQRELFGIDQYEQEKNQQLGYPDLNGPQPGDQVIPGPDVVPGLGGY